MKNPATGTIRYALKDYKLRNHLIPKGTMVITSFLGASMNKGIWGDDYEEFKPERFMHRDLKDLRYIFTPFSMGPRVCIGKRFSEMEMILILAKSMMRYKIIEGENLKDIKEIVEATVKPSAPIRVKLSMRK